MVGTKAAGPVAATARRSSAMVWMIFRVMPVSVTVLSGL
jgi:hypothetical protein